MAPETDHPAATPAQSHVNMPTPPSVAGPVPTSPEVQAPSLPPSREPANLQSRTDRARNRAAIETKIRQVRGMLASLGSRNLPRSARDDRDRVASLVELAQQALAQGNLRQADDLSVRAAMLAKTLTDAK
jgi:hypothetical protein